MERDFKIRAVRPEDADRLTALAFLAKAHWGYPSEWLEAWRAELTLTPAMLAAAMGYVAELGPDIIGFWVRAALDSDQLTPGWLFVHPEHMGRGVAHALWGALRNDAAARGIRSFVIEADPHAVPFYRKLGAERIGEKASVVIPERVIPILRIPIHPGSPAGGSEP